MRLPLWFLRWMHKQKLSRKQLRGGRLHGWFGDRILEKELWLPTRNSLARAWLIGFPVTVVPFLPGQSVFAIIGALVVRGNLLLCIALQFLSTPLTAPVHLPACYFMGQVVRYYLGTGGASPGVVWAQMSQVSQWSWDRVSFDSAKSLYLGAIVIGFVGGLIGYGVLHQTWRDKPRKPTRPPVETGTSSPL